MKHKKLKFAVDCLLSSLLLISYFYDNKNRNHTQILTLKLQENSYFFKQINEENNQSFNIYNTSQNKFSHEQKIVANRFVVSLNDSYLPSEAELQSITYLFNNSWQKQNQSIDLNIDEPAPLAETAKTDLVASNSNSTETTNSKIPLILSVTAILLGLINLGFALFNYLMLQKFINYQKKNRHNIRNNSKQIKNLENIIQNNSKQIEIFNRDLYDLEDSVNTQSSRLKQLEFPSEESSSSHNPNTDSVNYNLSSHNTVELTQNLPPQPENIRLAQNYRENPVSLFKQGTQVGMTKETTNQILGGVWEQIYLEENRRTGEYFIVTSNSGEMYLFLNPNSMFNPQTLSTIHKSQLFICHGNLSQSRKGIDINIQKPARVKKDAQYWALVESGEIVLE